LQVWGEKKKKSGGQGFRVTIHNENKMVFWGGGSALGNSTMGKAAFGGFAPTGGVGKIDPRKWNVGGAKTVKAS